ncbi:hypothetical protein ACOQFB_05240 [Anaeromyxobacter sp. Red801]|uniref:hypothetical protein n=1 Tax=Anaeromyxobacter sp. Red801 TaxID=3411632 RepID=UPI003BA0D265
MTFDQFVETIRHLRRDRSGGRPKPYKPLMLASVVVLIHKGEIRTREVFLDGGLESVFHQLLRKLFPGEFESARALYPFLHLETDRVWRLVPKDGAAEGLRAAKESGASEWRVLKSVRCAALDPEVFEALASSFQSRFRVLQTLIQEYDLPRDRTGHLWDLLSTEEEHVEAPVAREPGILTEKALEQHLQDHWPSTEFARLGIELADEERHGLPGRQVLTPRNTIDLLGYREDAREWWVFELKKGRSSDAVVGQVQRYMGWIAQQAKPREQVRGAIIVGRTDENLKASVASNDRLSLWRYDAELRVSRVAVG